MGEYILLDGVPVKIGTCENLYYCRYTDLVEWIDAGRAGYMTGNAQPARYLTGAYHFRFPFPDEDGPEHARLATYAAEFNRGVLIPSPLELLTAEIEHFETVAQIQAYLVRFFPQHATIKTPCPLSADKPAWFAPTFGPVRYDTVYTVTREPWVEVVRQRPLDGMLWAVFRCPWCHAHWRVDREAAERIAAHALVTAPELELGELMERMLAGYDGLPGRPVSFAEPGGA